MVVGFWLGLPGCTALPELHLWQWHMSRPRECTVSLLLLQLVGFGGAARAWVHPDPTGHGGGVPAGNPVGVRGLVV